MTEREDLGQGNDERTRESVSSTAHETVTVEALARERLPEKVTELIDQGVEMEGELQLSLDTKIIKLSGRWKFKARMTIGQIIMLSSAIGGVVGTLTHLLL